MAMITIKKSSIKKVTLKTVIKFQEFPSTFAPNSPHAWFCPGRTEDTHPPTLALSWAHKYRFASYINAIM